MQIDAQTAGGAAPRDDGWRVLPSIDAPTTPEPSVSPAVNEDAETLLALKNLEKRKRDKKRKRRIKVVAAVAALAVAGGVAFAVTHQPKEEEEEFGPIIEYVGREDFETTTTGSGALNPFDIVLVSPEVGGVVESVAVEEGQDVEQGDVLFTLKSDELDKAIEDASDQVNAAAREVDEAQVAVDQARRAKEQARKEYEKAAAQAERDQERAQSAYDKAYNKAMKSPDKKLAAAQATAADAARVLADAQTALGDAKAAQTTAEAQAKAHPDDAAAAAAATAAATATAGAEARVATAEAADANASKALAKETEAHAASEAAAAEAAQKAYDAVSITEVPDYSSEAYDVEIESAQSGVTTAQAALETASRAYDEAQEQHAKRIVKAPKAGTLVSFGVKVGTGFGESTMAASAEESIQIADVSKLKVSIDVDESEINDIEEGMTARCTFAALPDVELKGKVVSVAPTASSSGEGSWSDSGSATFAVEVIISKPDPRLRLGMSTEVEIVTQSVKDALVVPTSVLDGEGDTAYVEVVLDEETMETELREVRVGPRSTSEAVIEEGLEEGDAIVVPDLIYGSGGDEGYEE